MEQKHGEKHDLHRCPLCKYETISKISLVRHKTQRHFPCYLCEEVFDDQAEIDEHILFLHPDDLVCSVCHLRFPTISVSC